MNSGIYFVILLLLLGLAWLASFVIEYLLNKQQVNRAARELADETETRRTLGP